MASDGEEPDLFPDSDDGGGGKVSATPTKPAPLPNPSPSPSAVSPSPRTPRTVPGGTPTIPRPSPTTGDQAPADAYLYRPPPSKPPAARRGVKRTAGEASGKGVFAGLVVAVVVGGRQLGRVRARVIADLIQRHGGTVATSLMEARVVVTGYETMSRLRSALREPIPAPAHAVTPNWVSDCVASTAPCDPAPYALRNVPSPSPRSPPPRPPSPHQKVPRQLDFHDDSEDDDIEKQIAKQRRLQRSAKDKGLLPQEEAEGGGAERKVQFSTVPAAEGLSGEPPLKRTKQKADDPDLEAGFTSVFFGPAGGNSPPRPQAAQPAKTALRTTAGGGLAWKCPELDFDLEDEGGGVEGGDDAKLPTSHPAVVPASSAKEYMPPHANTRHIDYLRARKPFACQKGKKTSTEDPNGDVVDKPSGGPNQYLIDELTKLFDIYNNTGDQWRKYAYSRAIGIIKRWKSVIRSKDDLAGVKGIGGKIANKIEEILTTGSSAKLTYLQQSAEVQAVCNFGKIWGVGPATARKLFLQGITSIPDLQTRAAEVLTDQQRVGLKYFDELQERIPRAEVSEIEGMVKAQALAINPHLDVETCGSYRRGKATCGDIDILICDKRGKLHDGILLQLVGNLRGMGLLTDDLTSSYKSTKCGEADTWFGVCQLPKCDDPSLCPHTHLRDIGAVYLPPGTDLTQHVHRRLDIKVYPKEHYPFAVLYFTGSDYFNRSMRLYCHRKGLSLSDKSLCPVVRVSKETVHDGAPIPCATERDIFETIGLEYKTPEERDL